MAMNVYDELTEMWKKIPGDSVINSGFDITLHKKMLDILHVGAYYYYIINIREGRFEVVSPEIVDVLGYPLERIDLRFIISSIHPDDLPSFLNFEAAIEKFFRGLSGEKLFRYKVQYDCRMRKADGSYVRMLNQLIVIQHDSENVRTFVVNTDISHLRKEPIPVLSFIGLDGEPSYYNVDVENIYRPSGQLFTKRELDVLKALINGMNSKEIGDLLGMSRHTVNTHRKNMLRKANAKSVNEVIRIAFDNGWA